MATTTADYETKQISSDEFVERFRSAYENKIKPYLFGVDLPLAMCTLENWNQYIGGGLVLVSENTHMLGILSFILGLKEAIRSENPEKIQECSKHLEQSFELYETEKRGRF